MGPLIDIKVRGGTLNVEVIGMLVGTFLENSKKTLRF